MVYRGLVLWDGQEVVNVERTAAYVANGIAPGGDTIVTVTDVVPGLAAAAYGDLGAYTTPVQDKPPWYDPDDPDTWDFAGLIPVDLTGLDSSTRTVDFTDTIGGGGIASRAVRGPRTSQATALLVGRTTEGVQAGLSWLTRVLHGQCRTSDCDPTGDLQVLTAVSEPPTVTARLDVAPVTVTVRDAAHGDPSDWSVRGGTFTDSDGTGTLLRPYDTTDTVDAGNTAGSDDTIDAGGAGSNAPDVIDGGTAAPNGQAVLTGPAIACTDGPATITWSLRGHGIPQTARLVLLDDGAQIIQSGPLVTLGSSYADVVWQMPLGTDDAYVGLVTTNDTIGVGGVSVARQPDVTAAECVQSYRRTVPRVATVAGPTEAGRVAADCAELLLVEWTWVAGSPYRYGLPRTVVAGLALTSTGGTYIATAALADPVVAYGTRVGASGTTDSAPYNCPAPADEASCALDPSHPPFTAGPNLPVVPDPSRATITGPVREVWASIGPEAIPGADGVFQFNLHCSAKPVVGARLRVYNTADPSGALPDPCDFLYEYLIDYVPAGGLLTIDGISETVTTTCTGSTAPADASGSVHGSYGGPLTVPTAVCNGRYLIELMWLDTYPRSGGSTYTNGAAQGSLTLDVAVAVREG